MNIERIIRSMKSNRFFIDLYSFIAIKLGYANTDLGVEISRHKIYKNLKKKYYKYLNEDYTLSNKSDFNRKIWVCWLQGFEQAPDIVKECYKSIKKNTCGYEVIPITLKNLKEYVDIPTYILKKWEKGIISNAHFSDIIRLELLIRHGGIWLDSTVWCTGDIPSYITNTELFVYREGWYDAEVVNMGNWLIGSSPNNHLLKETLKLLYKYWEDSNHTYDYFLFHIFFKMVSEKYVDEWNKVPVFYQNDSHILMHELFNRYDSERYREISKLVPFHKLTVKFTDEKENIEGTLYKELLRMNQ